MENIEPFLKPHSIQQISSKSYTHFFFKSFIIILVLVFLPLFPSKAPKFVNQTMLFSKLWELIYLFVIGIVLSYSYGLITRRNVKLDSVNQSNIDSSSSYLSGISHVSSFFEDGSQNLYGSYEKNVAQRWNFDENCVLDEIKDCRSSKFHNGFENPHLVDEKKVTQAWNSQDFVGESVVFVASGKPKSRNGYKPLNLPVRSLRSRTVDAANSYEAVNESGFNSTLKGFDGIDENNKVKVRGLVPINLEEKFKETILPSPVPWGSRSGRMEFREEVGNVRAPSAGEIAFECLKSLPVRSSSPILTTISPEGPNSEVEDFMIKDNLEESFPPVPLSSLNGKASFKRSISQGSSISSSFEANVEKSCVDNLNGFGNSENEGLLRREKVDTVKPPSHSRPHSVGEVEFESWPLRSSFPTPTTVFPEVPNSEMEGSKRKENIQESFPAALHSSFSPLNAKASFSRSNRRRFNIGSSSDVNVEKSSEDNWKGFVTSEKEDLLRREKMGIVKPPSHSRPPSVDEILFECPKSRLARSSEPNPTSVSQEVLNSEMEGGFKRKENLQGGFPPSLQSSLAQSNGKASFTEFESWPLRSSFPTPTTVFPEVPNSEMEGSKRKENIQESFPAALQSSFSPLNAKASFSRSNRRRFNIGSSSDVNVEKSSEDNWKGFVTSEKEDLLRREKMGIVKPPSHSRPPSVDEIVFECPKSRLARSSEPNPTSVSQEVLNSGMEGGFKRKENLQGGFPPLQSSLAQSNGKASFTKSNGRLSSIGSSTDVNVEKSFGDCLKGLGKNEKEDLLRKENNGVDSLKSDVKPATFVKGLTRGKSVRTVRSNEMFVGSRKKEEVCSSHIDGKVAKQRDKIEAGSQETSKKKIDDYSHMQNSRLGKNQNGERQKYGDNTFAESKKTSEFEKLHVTADEEETEPGIVSDTQTDSDEVDKKASEFIAKFREQIRLQRVASMKGLNCW